MRVSVGSNREEISRKWTVRLDLKVKECIAACVVRIYCNRCLWKVICILMDSFDKNTANRI